MDPLRRHWRAGLALLLGLSLATAASAAWDGGTYVMAEPVRFRYIDKGPAGFGASAGIFTSSPWKNVDWGLRGGYSYAKRGDTRYKRTDWYGAGELRCAWWGTSVHEGAVPYVLLGASGGKVKIDAAIDGVDVRHDGFRGGLIAGVGVALTPAFSLEARYHYVQHWKDYSPSEFGASFGITLPLSQPAP